MGIVEQKAVSDSEHEQAYDNMISAQMALNRAEQELEKGRNGERKEEVAAAEADILNMEVSLRIAEDRLKDTTLRAPFDGVVTNKMIDNFEMVGSNREVIVLHDMSKLKVRIFLPENELIRRPQSTDMEADVVFTENATQAYKAGAFEVDTNPTETKGMYAVTFLFTSPEEINVLPGMTAEVILFDNKCSEQKLVVPASAVLGDEFGKSYVWTVDAMTSVAVKKEFRRGLLTHDEKFIVNGGLPEGAVVVTEGNRFLSDGIKVNAVTIP